MEYKKLLQELSNHKELLKTLHDVLKQELKEMSAIKLDAMNELNLQKESLSKKIKLQNDVLKNTIANIIVNEMLPVGTSLGDIAEKFRQNGKPEISNLHKDLNLLVNSILQSLAVNKEIAEKFSLSVKTSLDLLVRVINQSNTYGASGGYQQRKTGSIMINREA